MEIVKSKRKGCKCKRCWKKIDSKYKVLVMGYNSKDYYHLSCYYKFLKDKLSIHRKQLKKFSYGKYKRVMILEGLS